MPTIPPPIGTPYDGVTNILNAARFRLNDKLASLYPTSGKILDETMASTQQATNNAYRRFQDALCDAGVERFKGEVIIPNIPVVTNLDPASKCSINWFTFFDGTNYQTQPTLPGDLILPLWMSDRPAVSSGPNPFFFPDVNQPNMYCQTDGLQTARKFQANRQWEWRQDTIFFPGSIIPVDFRIVYRCYLADFNDVGSIRWFQQAVPIMRCLDPFAWWICVEFASARAADGDATEQMLGVAADCLEQAVNATKLLANRDVMKNERDDVRRLPYGGGSRGYGGGYGGR